MRSVKIEYLLALSLGEGCPKDSFRRERPSLVDEYKPAGSYEITFDASHLSSGVYFYRLQAGNPSTSSGQGFVETKKLTLLR